MLTIVAVPMAAAETDYEYGDETQIPTTDITLYDLAGSEIEIINGSPYIIVEAEDKYINIPLPLFDTMDMMADGVPITIEVDGNYLLIPTEDGIERVCISEFDVELIDGQLMIMHEVNPDWMGIFDIVDIIDALWGAVGGYIRYHDSQIMYVNRWIRNRGWEGAGWFLRDNTYTIPNTNYFDLDIPGDITGVFLQIRVWDADPGERHYVDIVCALDGTRYSSLGVLSTERTIWCPTETRYIHYTGSDRWTTTTFRITNACGAYLDNHLEPMLTNNRGRVRVRINTCIGGHIFISRVRLVIDN